MNYTVNYIRITNLLLVDLTVLIFQVLFFVILNLTHARPQSGSVEEVIGVDKKAAVLDEFSQGRSILYQSLPGFQEPHQFTVEVESQVLFLTKPANRDAKRKEKAEKRIQTDS